MTTHNSRKIRGNLLLLLTAAIWGAAFVAQKTGGDQMGPLTFNGIRSVIGAVGLLLILPLTDRMKLSRKPADPAERRYLLKAGILCGLTIFAATNLQQLGLVYTSAGKGGFLTALYILIVPFLGLFLGHRPKWVQWVGVGIALIGMYLLCCCGETGFFGYGDLLVLLCALMYALQIQTVAYFPQADGVRLCCIQFATVAVLTLPLSLIFEHPSIGAITDGWISLLYSGLLSSGVAYTLQIIAQRMTNPVSASLLMSLESVFAALTGWALLHERLEPEELSGCILMFVAIILAQLPVPHRHRKKEPDDRDV